MAPEWANSSTKRTQTGASPNTYLHIYIYISIHLGLSIIQLQSTQGIREEIKEQPENIGKKENAASELLFNCSKFIFLHHFHSHN